MVAFNKFEVFVTDLSNGSHAACMTADTDVLKVYLSNAVPSASLDSVKENLDEINMTNEATHGAGGADIENLATESAGTITVGASDKVFTASGGTVGPFQYVVLYNDTQTSPADPLIGWWDYGSAITLNDGETFTVDFTVSAFTLS